MGLIKLFLDGLYPRHITCDLCRRDARLTQTGPGAFLCPACLEKLEYAPPLVPFDGLDGLSAGLRYNEAAAELVHRFKYSRAAYLADTLAALTPDPGTTCSCLVPVPLHRRRVRQRGYNQSALLADRLGERLDMPVRTDLLRRVRNTPSQARLQAAERPANVRDAFRASRDVKGLSILLVDDVCTTGATLQECAKTLRQAGAAAVYAVTACVSRSHTALEPASEE